MKTIFISIASYDEKYLYQTVKSAILNASNSDRLIFGIFDQRSDTDYPVFDHFDCPIFHVKSSFDSPLGQGIARSVASLMNNAHVDYYLQIDAHMIFKKNWDLEIIDYFEDIKKMHDKVVISHYPPYWFEDNGNVRILNRPEIHVDPYNFNGTDERSTTLSVMDYSKYMNVLPLKENIEMALGPRHVIPVNDFQVDWGSEDWQEQYVVAGGFLFSDYSFISDIMIDPAIIWAGDEITVSIRAWTRGYRFYTIKYPIMWHMSKSESPITNRKSIRKDHWIALQNHKNEFTYEEYFYNNWLKSCRRIKDICIGDYIGYWGAQSMSMLTKYQREMNIDFTDYYSLLEKYLIRINDEKSLAIMYDRNNYANV